MNQMSIRDLYNMITVLPEAGLEYLVTKMVAPNQLAKDEVRLLTEWISKNTKMEHPPVMRQILLAIQYSNIQYIANPTEEECLKAIYEDPMHIAHIDNPSETVQMAAAKSGKRRPGEIFKLLKNPARAMWKLMFEEKPEMIVESRSDDEEFQLISISKKPTLITNPMVPWTVAARRKAFESDLSNFPYLEDQTEEDAWAALHHDSLLLRYVKNPTDEMKSFCILVA